MAGLRELEIGAGMPTEAFSSAISDNGPVETISAPGFEFQEDQPYFRL